VATTGAQAPGDEATIRPATKDDIPTIDALLRAYDSPNATPRLEPGAYHDYLDHLLSRGTAVVAETATGIVGFGASVDTGRAVHLADLFVDEGLLGHGLGRRLLEPLFPDGRPRTTFASDDPRAMNLYVGLGMIPLWPNFYVDGRPSRLPAALGVEVDDAETDEVAALELEWTGIDRAADYRIWGARAGHRPFVARAGGGIVAAGHSRRRHRGGGRWLDRLVPAPDVDSGPAVIAALRHAADGDEPVGACLIGPNPALRPLLVESGFRIVDRDTVMASDERLFDPRRIYDTGIP
jgi:GNAT superfamily N-acetyltransferase